MLECGELERQRERERERERDGQDQLHDSSQDAPQVLRLMESSI